MIQCDDECPRPSLAGPILGALATIAAAAVGPLLELHARKRAEQREDGKRLARLEGLLAAAAEDKDEDE